MKILFNLTLLIAVAAALFSCSKKEELAAVTNPTVTPVISSPERSLNYISKWTTLAFSTQTSGHFSWLLGKFFLPDTAGLNYRQHKQFVFIRLKRSNAWVHNALPLRVDVLGLPYDLNYIAVPAGFEVKIMGTGTQGRLPDPNDFLLATSAYRFLAISDSTYRAHSIDWTNYEEVARTLGPTIWFE